MNDLFEFPNDPARRYDEREDETKLAPLVIKYGVNPLPDPTTPEGRYDLHLNAIMLGVVIVGMILGSIIWPSG